MSDLISRTVLIDYIKNWDIGCGVGHDQKTFINAIEEQPTVEAKPVVHGSWETEFTALLVVYRCSECNCATALGQTNFCPNCGARMDGKQNVNLAEELIKMLKTLGLDATEWERLFFGEEGV